MGANSSLKNHLFISSPYSSAYTEVLETEVVAEIYFT